MPKLVIGQGVPAFPSGTTAEYDITEVFITWSVDAEMRMVVLEVFSQCDHVVRHRAGDIMLRAVWTH